MSEGGRKTDRSLGYAGHGSEPEWTVGQTIALYLAVFFAVGVAFAILFALVSYLFL